jgi:hypothetical protein
MLEIKIRREKEKSLGLLPGILSSDFFFANFE